MVPEPKGTAEAVLQWTHAWKIKILNKQPNLTPEELEKAAQAKHKVNRKQEITKISAERSEVGNRKTIENNQQNRELIFFKTINTSTNS